MDFINLRTITKEDYLEVLAKYGGQFSLFQRVIGEAKGLGGLKLDWEHSHFPNWKILGNESAVLSIEKLKQGCIFRMNDTKQEQAFLFRKGEMKKIAIEGEEGPILFGSRALNEWVNTLRNESAGQSFRIRFEFEEGNVLVLTGIVSSIHQINAYFTSSFFAEGGKE